MKKHFYPESPSTREMIVEAAREQGRDCEMVFDREQGTRWLLDGYEYKTGEANAVLGVYN